MENESEVSVSLLFCRHNKKGIELQIESVLSIIPTLSLLFVCAD